mgnify:CR=1 FL=1
MSDEAQETRPKVWIYALLDPETGEPRYVGKAINPQVRYAQHLSERGRKTHKQCWLAKLNAYGLVPTLELLEQVPEPEWQAAERHYIAEYRRLGARLTNGDDGGYGGKTGPENRARYCKRMLSKMYRDFVRHGQIAAADRLAAKLRFLHAQRPDFMPGSWRTIGLV